MASLFFISHTIQCEVWSCVVQTITTTLSTGELGRFGEKGRVSDVNWWILWRLTSAFYYMMGISTHCHHIAFFSKDSLRFETIESFLQRKTSKLLTDFCVLHTKWIRIIKHFLGRVYFSRIIVHFQMCDPEKLRRGHVPALWKTVAVGIPCQLANNQRKKCLVFPKPEFLEHRWPIHCFKGERFLMRPCSYGSEPI